MATETVSGSRLPSSQAASGSYTRKVLRAKLVLPTANFPGTSSNTLTLVGYRMSATIQQKARWANSLELTVFGMRQADMNQVTVIFSAATPQTVITNALITLEASPDGGQTWVQVFSGTLFEASPDYRSVPHACLKVLGFTGYASQISTAPATAYRGSAAISTIAEYLVEKMGFVFENNGVTGNLASPYFPGTYMDQFQKLARQANFDYYFDGNETLAICPANMPRLNKTIPVFTPNTGLVSTPTVQKFGVRADVLFRPAVTTGGLIQIAGSIVPSANGTWLPYSVTHNLESEMPGGAWFSSMDCQPSWVVKS